MLRLLSVADLNLYLRELLDTDEILRDLWVEGEVSNMSRPASGHVYFTLKHGDAQIKCACWKSSVARLTWLPTNGDAVLAHGRVGYYEVNGNVQLYIDGLRPAGIGLLNAQFEELKARLEAEGLFDLSRKRPLPLLPRRIGIATSTTGAALQDILNVLQRRYPLAEVLVAGCKVQGAGAAETIVAALEQLYAAAVDVVIVARGGGSIEDLWAFNEEIVARAVFASPVPLVSGVGHETDTTIIDYVADLRAPTPSAAAMLMTPDVADLRLALRDLSTRLDELLGARLDVAEIALAGSTQRLALRSPAARIERDQQRLDEIEARLRSQVGQRLALLDARLGGAAARLAALNPRAVLSRGYAIVRQPVSGAVVVDPAVVMAGELLEIVLRDGLLNVVAAVGRE